MNLELRIPKVRPTLEAMRRKLASAPQKPVAKPAPAARKSRKPGVKSLMGMGLACMLLVAAHFLAHSHREEILEAVGWRTFSPPLAPPAGLSLDDRARFWAFAAFDSQKLRQKFKVPASAMIDAVDAQHHLEDLLTQDLGAQARAEVMELKQPPIKARR